MTEEKKNPEVIEDAELDETSGGLLLPAIQKVRDAAARSQSSGNSYTGVTQVNQGVVQATPPKPED